MEKYSEIRKKIFVEIEKNKAELFELNGWLFDNPELSGEEFEASRKITELLEKKGFECIRPFAGFDTAFLAKYGNGAHRRKAAVLVEYDALPTIGHAAGHCLSCSMGLLGALALTKLQDELDMDVHVIGTPAEETYGAKAYMVDQGIFSGYDAAIVAYPYNWNLVSPKLFALSTFMYNFHGKPAHAATSPWEGRNAFNAGQLFFIAVDMLRQQMTPDSRVNGIFREAGLAPNIIPDEISVEMYIRSTRRRMQAELINKIDECARGAAIATGTTWDKELKDHPLDPMKTNASGVRVLKEIYEELGLELDDERERNIGSFDTGNVSSVCPTLFPCIETVPRECSPHSREFASYMKSGRALSSLEKGAQVTALCLAKIFGDEKLLANLKADFENPAV